MVMNGSRESSFLCLLIEILLLWHRQSNEAEEGV